MQNAVAWFEIPVENIGRAVRFYEAMLAVTLQQRKLLGTDMAIIPSDGVMGALLATPRHKAPSTATVVYLHVGSGAGCLDAAIRRACDAGGQLLVPPTELADDRWFAVVRDCEGNAIGLHAVGAPRVP
jgi:hypothetical protein